MNTPFARQLYTTKQNTAERKKERERGGNGSWKRKMARLDQFEVDSNFSVCDSRVVFIKNLSIGEMHSRPRLQPLLLLLHRKSSRCRLQ